MEPLRVVVRRGEVAESIHVAHAVAVRDGDVLASVGDPRLVTFMRSAAKPLQALPLVRARADLDDAEVAIAAASHRGLDAQLAAVRSLLAKAGATEEELECGAEQGSRLRHNCSGKHAGMLALCAAEGWPRAGYRLPEHPVQQACAAEVASAAAVRREDVPTATDGCGVVNFALPLERMAHAFARLPALPGGDRVARAMRAHPELIRGPGAPDTELMQQAPGWVAKGGAEGVLCASGPGGTGLALKVADGAARAVGPALAVFLRQLGVVLHGFDVVPLVNSRGEEVGGIAAGL